MFYYYYLIVILYITVCFFKESFRSPIDLDHDECLTSNHGCQHKCVNEHGSFSCRCDKGYELNNDNKTCSGEMQVILYYCICCILPLFPFQV